MSWTPQTPKRRGARGHTSASASAPAAEPLTPITPSRNSELVTTTVTITRSSAHRTSTRTITTTANDFTGLPQDIIPLVAEDDAPVDRGYDSSPSPIFICVPLSPSPTPAPATVRKLPALPHDNIAGSFDASKQSQGRGSSGAVCQSPTPIGNSVHRPSVPAGSHDRHTAPATGHSSHHILSAERAAAQYERILAAMTGKPSPPSNQPAQAAVVSHQAPAQAQAQLLVQVPAQTSPPASIQVPAQVSPPAAVRLCAQPAHQQSPSRSNAGVRVIRVYIPTKPKDLVIPDTLPLHVLCGGGGFGMFKTQKEVEDVCKKAGWKSYQVCFSREEALEVYTAAWESGTIIVEPDEDGPFAKMPFVDLEVPNVKNSLPEDIPSPSSLVRPVKERRYYYVVFVGEEVGIFGSWHEAAIRTQRIRNGYCLKYEYWHKALKAYRDAHAAERLSVRPRRWGLFDPAVASLIRDATKSTIPA